jgi:hypothetical protein
MKCCENKTATVKFDMVAHVCLLLEGKWAEVMRCYHDKIVMGLEPQNEEGDNCELSKISRLIIILFIEIMKI